MKKHLKIVITGRIRSGKTTAMNILKELAKADYNIDLEHIRMADPLYAEVKWFYDRHDIPFRKFRKMFDAMGEVLSDHGDEDKLLRYLKEMHDLNSDYIIDDARRTKQADFLKNDGAIFIRIEATDKIRKERCLDAGEWTEGHISDTELDEYRHDYLVLNTFTKNELREDIKEILDSIMAARLSS
jgi:dephospho-CoA kinase